MSKNNLESNNYCTSVKGESRFKWEKRNSPDYNPRQFLCESQENVLYIARGPAFFGMKLS